MRQLTQREKQFILDCATEMEAMDSKDIDRARMLVVEVLMELANVLGDVVGGRIFDLVLAYDRLEEEQSQQ